MESFTLQRFVLSFSLVFIIVIVFNTTYVYAASGVTVRPSVSGQGEYSEFNTLSESIDAVNNSSSQYHSGYEITINSDQTISESFEFKKPLIITSKSTKKLILNGSVVINAHAGITFSDIIIKGDRAKLYGNGNKITIENTVKADGENRCFNSIYGGSERNPSPSSNITIKGGRIGLVFGGGKQGNIKGDVNIVIQGAETSDIFGGGHEIMDGSTTPSNVMGNVSINISGNNTKTGNVYGAGYIGDITGNVKINVSSGARVSKIYGGGYCSYSGEGSESVASIVKGNTTISVEGLGTNTSDIFGGAYEGHIKGSVNIKVAKGASSGNVYGGGGNCFNDSNGNIKTSSIGRDTKIIIDDSDTTVGNVYGGGYNGDVSGNTEIAISGGAGTGKVYGGGDSVYTFESTQILPYIKGNSKISVSGIETKTLEIFGGGREGITEGNTEIFVYEGAETGNIYGGNEINKYAIAGQTELSDFGIKGDSNICIYNNGTTTGNVYGGGLEGITGGKTHIKIYDGANSKNVYGGGEKTSVIRKDTNIIIEGQNTKTENVYGGSLNGIIEGSTEINILNGAIVSNVYGGGEKTSTIQKSTKIIIEGEGTTTSNVFGGGLEGSVIRDTSIYVKGAARTADIYGSSQITGNVDGDIRISIEDKKTSTGNIFGGGSGAKVNTIDVSVSGGAKTGNVYGGGEKAVVVSGISKIFIEGAGTTANDVFGGGLEEVSSNNVEINISGGANVNNVYGGGEKQNTKIAGSKIEVYGNNTSAVNVFGGSYEGEVQNDSSVIISNGASAAGVYGGGEKESSSVSNTSVLIEKEKAMTGRVFGGGLEGVVKGNSLITINGGAKTDNVYGGGEKLNSTIINSEIIIDGTETVTGHVFGGGLNGALTNNSKISLSEGCKTGDVFGGGDMRSVDGNVNIIISGRDTVSGNVYGGGNEGVVKGDASIILTDNALVKNVYSGGCVGVVEGKATVLFLNGECTGSFYKGATRENNNIGFYSTGDEMKNKFNSEDFETDVNLFPLGFFTAYTDYGKYEGDIARRDVTVEFKSTEFLKDINCTYMDRNDPMPFPNSGTKITFSDLQQKTLTFTAKAKTNNVGIATDESEVIIQWELPINIQASTD